MIHKDKLKIGDLVYFRNDLRWLEGLIIQKDKKSVEVTDIIKLETYIVPYYSLYKEEDIYNPRLIDKPVFYNVDDLYNFVNELKQEYQPIFKTFNSEQKKLLENVKIKWNNRKTYRNCGRYFWKQGDQIINEITISKTFKNAPKEVIKLILFHELLHIKNFYHYKKFKSLEKLYKNYEKVNNLIEVILINQRFKKMKK